MLYIPAINKRALSKLETFSGTMKPDTVVFDLEDGVSPHRKEEARENLLRFIENKKFLENGDDNDDVRSINLSTTKNNDNNNNNNDYFGLVRLNHVDTPWFEEDASMVMKLMLMLGEEWKMNRNVNNGAVNGVVLPKINGWKDVNSISQHFLNLYNNTTSSSSSSSVPTLKSQDDTLDDTKQAIVSPVPLWTMMETPHAILSALEIAKHPSIHGLILGTNDLAKELGLRPPTTTTATTLSAEVAAAPVGSSNDTPPLLREGLMTSLQTAILAAKSHRKIVIDGVYNNFRDFRGFRRECIQGKEWGMDGKTLIHPNQISDANEIYAPSAEEVEYARRVVACWEEEQRRRRRGGTDDVSANNKFSGVAVLDGMMIEQLHVDSARRLLTSNEEGCEKITEEV